MTSRITEEDLTVRTSAMFAFCVALGYVTPAEWPDWERRRKAALARGDLIQLDVGLQRMPVDRQLEIGRAVSNDKPVNKRKAA